MKPLFVIPFAIAFLLLSSCATKFTAAQKEALSSVSISPTVVEAKAYKEPDGGDRAAASQAGMTGATAGAGALGGLVGSLVGETIAATQNSVFKGKSKQHFEAVKSNTPEMSRPVSSELDKALNDDAFFGSRLRGAAPSKFTSTVESYGLVRAGKGSDGNLLLTAQAIVDIRLKDPTGKNLVGRRYVGTGYNHPITIYASSSSETKKSFEMASRMAVEQFMTELSSKSSE